LTLNLWKFPFGLDLSNGFLAVFEISSFLIGGLSDLLASLLTEESVLFGLSIILFVCLEESISFILLETSIPLDSAFTGLFTSLSFFFFSSSILSSSSALKSSCFLRASSCFLTSSSCCLLNLSSVSFFIFSSSRFLISTSASDISILFFSAKSTTFLICLLCSSISLL
jgi:hypothetical protein